MTSKSISMKDDVYKLLKDKRQEDESFSDVIERLLKKDKGRFIRVLRLLKR